PQCAMRSSTGCRQRNPKAQTRPQNRIDEDGDQRLSSPPRAMVRGRPRGHPRGAPHKRAEEDSPMAAYYVGLDVHSRDSAFVIQDEAGTILRRGGIPTTPEGVAHLRDEHQPPARTTLPLETGTSPFHVALLLCGPSLGRR